jgi:thioredoxin 1
MSEITFTSENFADEAEKSTLPVLIDFWAPWCMPCRMVGPVIEELAKAYDGTLKVGKVNVDEQGDLAERFRVTSIPTLIVMKGGQVVAQKIGAVPRHEIEAMFKPHL